MAERPPSDLLEELVEEILLRIPPHDPARLVRAATVCKRWCRLVSNPGFRRRFRERHRRAPELGVLRTFAKKGHLTTIQFVPTCSFCPRGGAGVAERRDWRAIDSRHGRVLLHSLPCGFRDLDVVLDVWDPVADELRELPLLPCEELRDWKAMVLCAHAAGECDHLDCHRGPFIVVVVGIFSGRLSAFAYSSESDTWSDTTSPLHQVHLYQWARGAHVGNALYYTVLHVDCVAGKGILKYDLATGAMTTIDLPRSWKGYTLPMTAEGGGLGCALLNGALLHLWSREAGYSGDMGWTQSKVIQLAALIPGRDMIEYFGPDKLNIKFDILGFADGGGVLYLGTNRGYYCADFKSGWVRKLRGISGTDDIVPFMSFYTPELGSASTDENAAAGASNA